MAKGYEELRRQYRELDRDCALLSRFWLDGKHKKSKIFLPTEEHMRQASVSYTHLDVYKRQV